MHKNAEVISIKEHKKEEKKEKGKEEEKKDKGKEEEKKDKGKEAKSLESTKVIEIHHSDTRDEIKIKDNNNVPYIIHYVYAPQLFSDENPNSCSIS